MAGKIVGTELIGRVLTIFRKVVGPLGDDVPVFVHIGGAAVLFAQLCGQYEHITSLFQRHITAINLTIGDGVGSQIVSGERLCPAFVKRIVEDGGHHGFLQFGVVAEEQRSLGIGEVHGIHATV